MSIRFTLHPLASNASKVWIALTAITLTPLSARADRAADTARAEAMFEEGRKLMAAHDYAAACPKLAESERLDPAPGTLLNLAVCYERAEKTATAWATYKSAALMAQRTGEVDRATAATRKATELESKLSHITFAVTPVAGLEVRCDGQPVREPSWGMALPYDPGDHDVEATAPGHRSWSFRAHISSDERRTTVTVPLLERNPAIPPPPDEASAKNQESPSPVVPPQKNGTQRLAGELLVVGGVLGIGAGVYTGLHAKSTYDQAVSDCGGTTCPAGSEGLKLRSQASDWATASTIAFIGGAAAVFGGALLFFTAPHGRATVALGPAARGTGLSLSGRF